MKKYIAAIGIYDENTTERIVLKEIAVHARDRYEAHKLALNHLKENQTVLKLMTETGILVFDFQRGF